jgi:glyoxylase-like metal-dependent hydrolase (beta-lactamase superfamily II)
MLIALQDDLYRLDTPFGGLPLSLYVITGEQTVLIDSGIATTPQEFIFPALDAAGLSPNLLICTHGHVDHFGGNSTLRERYPNMKIALQEDDALWAEDHERHLHEMYMCMPQSWQFDDGGKSFLELCGGNSAVDLYLRDGQELDLGSFCFRVIHTQGHSPGHIMLHDAARRVVICGDVALGWGALAPGAPKINPYYYNPDLYAHGIETALTLDGALYCTGHSGSLDQAKMQILGELSLEFVQSIAQWSLDALDAAEPRSLGTVARTVLASLPGYEIGFHLHASVQAHLSKHCLEGMVRAVMIDGLKHYLRVL